MRRDLDKQRWIKTKVKHRRALNEQFKPSFFNRLRRAIRSLPESTVSFTVDEWITWSQQETLGSEYMQVAEDNFHELVLK